MARYQNLVQDTRNRAVGRSRQRLLEDTTRILIEQPFDDFDVAAFVKVAACFGDEQFGFVVTPNVDHLIRLHDDEQFRGYYRAADYVLLDSRFAARLLWHSKRLRVSVCPGSDLTQALITQVVKSDDRLVVIGGSHEQAAQLSATYGVTLLHHNPPMGFINVPAALEDCLQFIEAASPFRFCFLAVGSPQQERVAYLLKERAAARGLALCIGASLNFLSGTERRAPVWMQRLALEWLFRLLQNPRRLAGRYLVRGPRIFKYLADMKIELRKREAPRELQQAADETRAAC